MSAPERHAQLLLVGREVFAERGLEGTSVEEVAARAGVSKPVLYEHFGGKGGLYAEVVDAEVRSLLVSFTSALSGDSPRLLLEQATLALLTYVQECTDGFRILVRESPVAGGTGSALIMRDVAQRVEHVLAELFDARGLDPSLAPLYAQALVGQVALVGQWWLDHRTHDRDEVAAHLVNLAWNGLAHLQPDPALRSR
jgi:AcrR family transcriptional regulator